MAEYLLPDVGEGLTEAEIVAWKVKVGDVIEINDIVVEIETAKSLVELPSPYAGTVTALLVAEGETVAVGTPIIAIGDRRRGRGAAGAAARRARTEIDLSNPAASGGGEGESLVGRNKADRGPARRARKVASGRWPPRTSRPRPPSRPAPRRWSRPPSPSRCRRRRPAPGRARDGGRPAACWPSRRCASWPRTSASTWPR